MSGTLGCQCGMVVLNISNPKPVMRIECGCCDCRQAAHWAQLQGGPKMPTDRPMDAWYFENDIVIASGADKIKWYKLRSGGQV